MTQASEIDVTVVIPAWKAAAFIRNAIESALAQEEVSVEVIVVDDASPDCTAEAAEEIRDPRLTVLRQPRNGGPASARNRAFDLARGRWIAIQDADDSMAPERLATLTDAGEAAHADAVVDDLVEVTADGRRLGTLFRDRLNDMTRLDLTRFMLANRVFGTGPNLGYMKPIFRRDFLTRHRLRYNPSLRIGEDYALLADCLAAGAEVVVVPQALYHYTRRNGSLSHRLKLADIAEMQAADHDFARRWPLDRQARAALAKRGTAFRDATAFVSAVEALKRRDWVSATAAILGRPRAALLFRYPLRARLDRSIGNAGKATR